MNPEEQYIIRPGTNYSPSPEVFWKMEKKKLKEFYQWFMTSLPYCIEELMQLVRNTSGFKGWSADYSPDSLDALGKWFAMQIKTRSLTEEEKTAIKATLPPTVEFKNYELTDETKSLALYVGMYYGQVAVTSKPGVKWDQSFQTVGKRKMADYGQPILGGVGVVPINPVRVAHSIAYGCASEEKKEAELRQAYDYWSNLEMPRATK